MLNGWFVQNRGKAIGITMAGTGVGAFILPPAVEFFIANYDWRVAYQVLGVGAFLVSLPVVYFLFRENTASDASSEQKEIASWGLTRAEALRTGRHWILVALIFTTVIVVV